MGAHAVCRGRDLSLRPAERDHRSGRAAARPRMARRHGSRCPDLRIRRARRAGPVLGDRLDHPQLRHEESQRRVRPNGAVLTMDAMKTRRFALRVLPALAALTAAAAPALAQEVGSAGAVNPASTGMPPGRASRVLELGARVIHKERIRTTGSGSVQLIFLDKTTLNIGPNSDIVIDEFVYDPNRGSGKMAVSMAKGVLRFVGGNVSHAGNATVTTPAATLGIRGGVATIKHNPCDGSAPALEHLECGTRAINHFGILTVTTLAGTEVIRRPGFAVTIANPSSPPPAPTRVSQAEIDETNAELS